MKKVKKEIEVEACELCGKELGKENIYEFFRVQGMEYYQFHQDCVKELLLKELKHNTLK